MGGPSELDPNADQAGVDAEVLEKDEASAEKAKGTSRPAKSTGWPRQGWWPRWLVAEDFKSWLASVLIGIAIGLSTLWFFWLNRMESDTKAAWFSGGGAFAAAAVALWQTTRIQRQAKDDAADAANRLQREIAAAEMRSAKELAQARELHQLEMDAQRELARAERTHLLEQQQKRAMVDVSRAARALAHHLATLWDRGVIILGMEDGAQRARELSALLKQLDQLVGDFSLELDSAHLLIEDDRLHDALDDVNRAALDAVYAAEEVRAAVSEGRAPYPNPIPPAQDRLHTSAADARRLAWELLQTGDG